MNQARMKYITAFVLAAVAGLLLCGKSFATITPIPSPLTVARGQAASRSITYNIQGIDILSDTITSTGGYFYVGGELVGTNSQVLTAQMSHNNATVTEALVIPVSIIEAALARHSNTITYQREFIGGVFPLEIVSVNIIVMSEAASDFEIKRMDLYFANRRPDITVGRNQKDLKAYVDIRYVGTGLLQAFWEVDGRVLATVNQHMTFAGNATLESPDIPALPTFDPGTHVVRFVITSPSPELTVPSIVYYVLPEESGPALLEPLEPADGIGLDVLPYKFRWSGTSKAAMYIVRYYADPEADPVFSAYTKDTFYDLPAYIPNGGLTSGTKYYWDVTALADDGKVVGKSPTRNFVMK
jgi:hypothetical protein